MRADAEIQQWEARYPVNNVTYNELAKALERHGFYVKRQTKHTYFWTHELLGDNPPATGGVFSLKERHAKGKALTMYQKDVQKAVTAVRSVEAVERELESKKNKEKVK